MIPSLSARGTVNAPPGSSSDLSHPTPDHSRHRGARPPGPGHSGARVLAQQCSSARPQHTSPIAQPAALLRAGWSPTAPGEPFTWALTLGMAGTQFVGAWALAGLIIAPPVLQRMAGRESGSRVAERRERALQTFS
jgi:hypothetical protein